jgi:hypothetical protein
MKTNCRNLIAIVAMAALGFVAQSDGAESTRLTDNRDGTVTDTKTGLIWTKAISSTKELLSQAKAAAAGATTGGHKDWRVSTRRELEEMAKIYPDYSSLLELQYGEYLTREESVEQAGSIYVIGIYPKEKSPAAVRGTGLEKSSYIVYFNGSKNYPFYYWLVRGPVQKNDNDGGAAHQPKVDNASHTESSNMDIASWINEATQNPDLSKDIVVFERWRQKVFSWIQKGHDRTIDKDTVGVLFWNAAKEDYGRNEPTPARSLARGLGYLEGLALAEKNSGNAPSTRAQIEQFIREGEKDNALRTDVPFQRWRMKVRAYLENTGFKAPSVEFNNVTWDFLYDKADEPMRLKQWLGKGLGVLDSFKETVGDARTIAANLNDSNATTPTARAAASAAKSSGIDPESRYKMTVNKIDPTIDEGVILKNSRGDVLRIGGPVSELMHPGDCTLEVKVKGATISKLTLAEPCVLTVAKDKTVVAEKENITAKDSKGNVWTSRKVVLDGKELIAFFPEESRVHSSATITPDSEKSNATKPATTATGLALLQTATVDIGKNGEILPHEPGVQAKDRQGNVWESRKTTLNGKEVLAFFQKEGAQTTTTETNDRPAKAKAALPPFNNTLDGTHEVRVLNPNTFLVNVGVRSGDSGKDFEVSANDGRESIFVPNGRYDIYFVYSDRPEDLYQGDSFNINGNGIQITITKVVNGNYGIRKVK